jgi:uncharacterized protein
MLTGSLPEQVDHRKLAAEKVRLEGSIPVAAFERLCGLLEDSRGEVDVRLQFRKGKKQKTFVAGTASGTVTLVCQNCLEPVVVTIKANFSTLLLDTLDELQALPQSEDGLVCPQANVELVDLVEDELMVSLPMVPRHDAGVCNGTLMEARADEAVQVDTYKPFAGLAALAQTQNKQRK